MKDEYTARNDEDQDGNPAGGFVHGTGLSINWQNGPLGRGTDRAYPNGAFVETVLDAVRQRIEFYETTSAGKFACPENKMALSHIASALYALNERTERREQAGVE